jgi:hypothetical protein
MTDYLCLTLLAKPDEREPVFKARLASFWTHMLRNRPDDYEKVYAEATRFTSVEGRVARQYMVEVDVVQKLARELEAHRIDLVPVDADDVYSKYEAASPDWFQIEH